MQNELYEHLNHELAQVECEIDEKVSGDLTSKMKENSQDDSEE